MSVSEGQILSDGSAKFAIRKKTYSKVGTVELFAGGGGSSIPTGYLLCDGSAISRTSYANLFAVIGTTYGSGDGSTTFNIPNLVGKFVEGSNASGTYKSAGIPNLTGNFYTIVPDDHSKYCCGVFKALTATTGYIFVGTTLDSTVWGYNFNAKLYSSVYSDSITTVQPPSLTMKYIIKY